VGSSSAGKAKECVERRRERSPETPPAHFHAVGDKDGNAPVGAGNFQFLPACQGHGSCTWFPCLEGTRKEPIQSSHLRCWPPTDLLMPLRFLLSLAVGRGRLVLVVKHGKYRFLFGGHVVLRVGPMGLPANEFETQKARLREGALPVSIVLLLPSPSEYGSLGQPGSRWKVNR